jgi:hypothetical protein
LSTTFHGITSGDAFGKPGPFLLALVASGSTLLDGLVSWWDLDETSGTRVAAVGETDLTDVNTVGYTSGKVGNAASFVAARTEYLYSVDGSIPEPAATSMSWSLWFYPTVNGIKYLMAKSSAGADFAPYVTVNPAFGGGEVQVLFANTLGSTFQAGGTGVSGLLNSWNHLVITWDLSTQVINAYVNGTALAGSPVTLTGTVQNNTGWFLVGAVPGAFWDGYVDLLGIWSRVLTADEITELYNAGAGIKNEFTDNGEGFRQGIVSYWNMDETGGLRSDSVGSNDLTDNNTVGSTTGVN